jgi:hypothetical protein
VWYKEMQWCKFNLGWWCVNGEIKVFCNWIRGWYTSGKRVGYFFSLVVTWYTSSIVLAPLCGELVMYIREGYTFVNSLRRMDT